MTPNTHPSGASERPAASALDKDLAAPLPITSIQPYRDTLIKELNTDNPLAIMMAEQLAVAHHIQLRLQVRVAQAKSAGEIQIVEAAACKLMGEFRRTATVLLEFHRRVAGVADTPTLSAVGAEC